MRPFFSICIPTYEMGGIGEKYLSELLESLNTQNFKDFDVIISDHSKGNKIKNLVINANYFFNIRYYKNKIMRGNPSNNLNRTLEIAEGEYIKILFQDDLLNGENSLKNLEFEIKKNKSAKWFLSGTIHLYGKMKVNSMMPIYNHKIHLGNNTISSPSVLTIKNEIDKIEFDEDFKWLLDCIYYKECFLKYGYPIIIKKELVINRISKNQLSNILSIKVKFYETIKSINKYEKGMSKYFLKVQVCVKHFFELLKNINKKIN